ncbi:MAG: RNA polymerase sigma factor [Thermomonas sp.]|jgi:RNA polymerase sigma-70 factor (ECF subfamily)|uniref:RNA polymerase sigma factor n=1 Tax=Thermomonas sp. TaxID=1971895 RepID=UPI001EB38584|nr:RNA polymerase sigma factor [Thermomonas sp.]MBV2208418.1 RNA polymerase sigma factor [Thermomonas sp.]
MLQPSQHSLRDYSALDDLALVACVQAGEHEAFRQITQRCNQRLFRVVRGVLLDPAEAEDVVQQAYVHAFEKIDSFRGEASLATWLVRIALNEAYGRLRRRHETVDIDSMEQPPTSAQVIAFPGLNLADDPAEAAARQQLRRLLERAMDALPEDFRLVYVLRDVEGFSVEEAAVALSIREETVKTRLHRARTQLRKALQAQLGECTSEAYAFMGERCVRMTEAVMQSIESTRGATC